MGLLSRKFLDTLHANSISGALLESWPQIFHFTQSGRRDLSDAHSTYPRQVQVDNVLCSRSSSQYSDSDLSVLDHTIHQ